MPTLWPFSPDETTAILLSLDVAARSILLGFPVALAAAVALSGRGIPGRALLDAVVHLPLVLPPVVVGWLLLLLFGIRGPVGALLLHAFGVRLAFTTWGAALACAVMALPLMVRAIVLSLNAMDPGLRDAARTLGAGRADRLFSVVLPIASPGLVTALLLGFAASLGEFGAVLTFAANIPGRTQILPLAIYTALQVPGGEARAARLAGVSLLLAVGLLIVTDRVARALNRRLGRI
jgi:molybdate transport system permease protein